MCLVPGNTAVIVNVINSTTISLALNQTMAKICGVEVRDQAGTLIMSRNASTSSEYVYVLTLDPVGTTSLNFTVTPCCGGNINAWWAYPLVSYGSGESHNGANVNNFSMMASIHIMLIYQFIHIAVLPELHSGYTCT